MKIGTDVKLDDAKLKRLQKGLDAVRPAILKAAGVVVDGQAVLLCPVDTGNLRNSITHKVEGDAVTIGTPVHYASHVEYGTSKMAAQPFLRPAVDESMPRLERLAADMLQKALDNT